MHQIEIPEANIKRSYPSDLSECDTVQYIDMCNLLFLHDTGEISLEQLRHQAVYFLLKIKKSKKSSSVLENEKFSNIDFIAETLESFFEVDENDNKVIKQYFINNPIEVVKGAYKNYYGPSAEFNNVTFGEYIDALGFFFDFADTKDPHYLYLLFATFYREKRSFLSRKLQFKTDKRIVYNTDRVETLANKFKTNQPIGVIYGFFLLFTSFQKYLTTAKIFIQGKEIDLSILYKELPTSKNYKSNLEGIGMQSILYSIAASGIFGPLEKVRATPFWEIIVRMYDIRKHDLDELANQKQQKNA